MLAKLKNEAVPKLWIRQNKSTCVTKMGAGKRVSLFVSVWSMVLAFLDCDFVLLKYVIKWVVWEIHLTSSKLYHTAFAQQLACNGSDSSLGENSFDQKEAAWDQMSESCSMCTRMCVRLHSLGWSGLLYREELACSTLWQRMTKYSISHMGGYHYWTPFPWFIAKGIKWGANATLFKAVLKWTTILFTTNNTDTVSNLWLWSMAQLYPLSISLAVCTSKNDDGEDNLSTPQ